MPRRSSRAAASSSSGGETNYALPIALVFFVLTSLTLGIMLYLEKDKVATAEKSAVDANASKVKVEKEKTELRDYDINLLKSYIDQESVSEDDKKVMTEAAKEALANRDEKFRALVKLIEGDPAGEGQAKNGVLGPITDPTTGKLKFSFVNRVKNLQDELKQTADNFKKEKDKLDALVKDYDAYKKDNNSDKTTTLIKAAQDAIETQMKQKLAQGDQALADSRKRNDATTAEVKKLLEDAKKENEETVKKVRAEVDAEKDKLVALQQELKLKYSFSRVVQLDSPRGRIVRVDSTGDTVYINLGSDAHLPAQLTFSVYGRGPGGKVLPEPKAKIELIRILDRTLALCRVTAVAKPSDIRAEADPDRDAFWINDNKQFYRANNPILVDDLLYNPVWDPQRPVHVALVGSFDLDGDGQDDLDAVLRMLREMGTIIDAYPDAKEGYKIIGRLDYLTDYLIVGATPPTVAGKVRTVDNRREFEEEARRRGVEILRLQRFLDKIGYSAIRIPVPKTLAPAVPEPAKKAPADEKEGK